jgi:hypothetical protein
MNQEMQDLIDHFEFMANFTATERDKANAAGETIQRICYESQHHIYRQVIDHIKWREKYRILKAMEQR